MKNLLIALLVFCSHAAFGQIRKLVTIAGGNSVVVFGGSVGVLYNVFGDKDEYRLDGLVTMKNVSPKDILAFRAVVSLPLQPVTYDYDTFFLPAGVRSGETFSDPILDAGHGDRGAEPVIPSKVQAKLIYAQFSDGTIWGDRELARKIFAGRTEVEIFLQNLLDTNQNQGEQAFADLLRSKKLSHSSVHAASRSVRNVYEKEGLDPTLSNIRSRLQISADRRDKGNF